MERLTEYSCGVAVIRNKNLINKAMYDLARYEDTGLTPEEVRALKIETGEQECSGGLLFAGVLQDIRNCCTVQESVRKTEATED